MLCTADQFTSGCSLEDQEHWFRDGHRIQRCDGSTGHAVTTVALCDNDETAERIIQALNME